MAIILGHLQWTFPKIYVSKFPQLSHTSFISSIIWHHLILIRKRSSNFSDTFKFINPPQIKAPSHFMNQKKTPQQYLFFNSQQFVGWQQTSNWNLL